jgi:hypothetical protein
MFERITMISLITRGFAIISAVRRVLRARPPHPISVYLAAHPHTRRKLSQGVGEGDWHLNVKYDYYGCL